MKTTVIYARVSTHDQDCDNQIVQLKEYASKQNWRVVDVIIDVCSGGKAAKERSGLDKIFKMAHQGNFEILLFWALDRLSREGSRKTIEYLTLLDTYGVEFHSYTEPYLSSLGIFADSIISLLSALAKQERIRISERTRAGLLRAKQNGQTLGRRRTAKNVFDKAISLRESGMTFAAIGRELGVSRVRAFQLVKGVV